MSSKRKSVLPENPILFLPSLAMLVGVECAIIIQRIEFFCGLPGGRVIDGEKWIWNTYEEWQRNHFPFWSVRTIQRHIQVLEEKGWILSAQPDGKISRKKYYRVSPAFKELATLEAASEHANLASSEHDKLAPSEHANLAPSVTDRHTERQSEKPKGAFSGTGGGFSDRNRRPLPTSEAEMRKILEKEGIEYDEDKDGDFFAQMKKARWRIRGKPIADWVKVIQARHIHTTETTYQRG